MEFEYIYGKQADQYDYLYIPKAFMKEQPFKQMRASAKILYAVLMEKQRVAVENKWVDDMNHVYILVNVDMLAAELNWMVEELQQSLLELEQVGLLEFVEDKIYLKRFV